MSVLRNFWFPSYSTLNFILFYSGYSTYLNKLYVAETTRRYGVAVLV